MDIGFYKRATRGIRHKVAVPFYPRKPAQVAPAAPAKQGGGKAKQPAAATTVRSVSPPPSTVVAMEVAGNVVVPGGGGAGGDTDVDRRAALYISRVQERLRRERMVDDWRKYY